jgi:hypothetical protein
MTDSRDPQNPAPPGFDIPDLDVSEAGRPRTKAPAQPTAAPAAPPAAAPQPSANPADQLFGAGMFDDDHFDAGAGSIELGSGHASGPQDLHSGGFDASHFGPGAGGAYAGGGLDDLDDDLHVVGPNLNLASYRPPAPSGGAMVPPPPGGPGTTPDRGLLEMDAAELAKIAGYGPAPSAIYLTPMYAWRVFSRQRELRVDIARLASELSNTEAARDQALANVVEALRPQLEADERFAQLMAPVKELDNVMRERSSALQSTNAEYRNAMARFEQEMTALDNQLEVKQKAVDAAQANHDARAQELARVEARHKRIQIEIRNFKQMATGGQSNAPLAPEHAAQIAPLEAQAAGLEPELAQRRAAVAQTRAVLDAAQREAQTIQQGKARVDGQRRQLDAQYRQQLDAAAAGVHDTEVQRRTLLADAARQVLHSGAFSIDDVAKSAIRQADAAVLRATTEHEKHLRALDTFDAEVATKGRNVAIGAAAGVVLLLIILILVL